MVTRVPRSAARRRGHADGTNVSRKVATKRRARHVDVAAALSPALPTRMEGGRRNPSSQGIRSAECPRINPACPPGEQGIDYALQFADHGPNPATLDQPLPCTGVPVATLDQPLPCTGVPGYPLLCALSHRTGRGQRTITQPTPSPNTTGPMLPGTSTTRLLLISPPAKLSSNAPSAPSPSDPHLPDEASGSDPLPLLRAAEPALLLAQQSGPVTRLHPAAPATRLLGSARQ